MKAGVWKVLHLECLEGLELGYRNSYGGRDYFYDRGIKIIRDLTVDSEGLYEHDGVQYQVYGCQDNEMSWLLDGGKFYKNEDSESSPVSDLVTNIPEGWTSQKVGSVDIAGPENGFIMQADGEERHVIVNPGHEKQGLFLLTNTNDGGCRYLVVRNRGALTVYKQVAADTTGEEIRDALAN